MLTIDLSHFPLLRTERLVLREVHPDDAPMLFAMRTDDRVMRYVPVERPSTVADSERFISTMAKDRAENNGLTWAITRQGDDTMVGTIGFYRMNKPHFRAEVGYMLHADHWGMGYAGEALDAVVDHGFSVLGFHGIEAITDPGNVASNGLLKSRHFVQEAHFKENWYWNGEFLDSLVWTRLVHGRQR